MFWASGVLTALRDELGALGGFAKVMRDNTERMLVNRTLWGYRPVPQPVETTGADRARHVHVAQSVYHDIAPATELGLLSIWINRLGEPADPRPARTLPGLTGLADKLDELVV